MNTQREQDLMILASAPTDQTLNDIELAALERERDREATATPAQASGNCPTSHSPLPWHESAGIITAGANPGQPYIADCRFGPEEQRQSNIKLIMSSVNDYADLQLKYAKLWEERHDLKEQLRLANIDAFQSEAHAQRIADALSHSSDKLNDLAEWCKAYCEPKQAKSVSAVELEAREALAQYNESSADADALEALDQLEQLEGGE